MREKWKKKRSRRLRRKRRKMRARSSSKRPIGCRACESQDVLKYRNDAMFMRRTTLSSPHYRWPAAKPRAVLPCRGGACTSTVPLLKLPLGLKVTCT
ncbi:hypothetical protein SERLA73DRAFT_179128 [Serpula lacrymans var. lacrymans S7.3]|uniref:60S ribosomal protein L41 n=2 Tax=Serpula lacrymans var. lacrymans TaxID=341189 RepID=F8PTT1_SERL3|nr:uncharacterized protein SERLADRAFT_464115 [Serpula lacrymans var. lacrymans S7.9]EGO01076.1 hypothetical protein SERLA73DRAFT_179128 [Serpula lacrymans var. lacrymans S7.3]EGO26734.1 hypothetical protein SERLADRAFT_464115 [Serpula lacrymans var. lacrymans S7.9]